MLFNPLSFLPALQLGGIFDCTQSLTGLSRSSQHVFENTHDAHGRADFQRDAFLDALVANMTIPELGMSIQPCIQSRLVLMPDILAIQANISSLTTPSHVRRQHSRPLLKQLFLLLRPPMRTQSRNRYHT